MSQKLPAKTLQVIGDRVRWTYGIGNAAVGGTGENAELATLMKAEGEDPLPAPGQPNTLNYDYGYYDGGAFPWKPPKRQFSAMLIDTWASECFEDGSDHPDCSCIDHGAVARYTFKDYYRPMAVNSNAFVAALLSRCGFGHGRIKEGFGWCLTGYKYGTADMFIDSPMPFYPPK